MWSHVFNSSIVQLVVFCVLLLLAHGVRMHHSTLSLSHLFCFLLAPLPGPRSRHHSPRHPPLRLDRGQVGAQGDQRDQMASRARPCDASPPSTQCVSIVYCADHRECGVNVGGGVHLNNTNNADFRLLRLLCNTFGLSYRSV